MNTGRSIGRRVAFWRTRRGLSQGDFGRLMGKSRRWVQDLEGGQRQVDPRLSVVEQAADVLRIPLERLVTDTYEEPAPDRLPADVTALVDALHLPEPRGSTVSVEELERRVAYCCRAWEACHYSAAARGLPALLADAHRTAESSIAAGVLLSRAYQLAASPLCKYGPAVCTSAVLAADRALAAAQRSGDPVAIGAAARRVARGLTAQQRYNAAATYATSTARMLREELEQGGAAGLSTLGMLYLVAAVAVAGTGRSSHSVALARERLAAAEEVARQQGEQEGGDFTSFGNTNVALHEVDVLLRLDDPWSAVERAQSITEQAVGALGRERQARYLVTTARARALSRERGAAVHDLLKAERLAPEEVLRPSVTGLVGELLELMPRPGLELTGLARRCGLPG